MSQLLAAHRGFPAVQPRPHFAAAWAQHGRAAREKMRETMETVSTHVFQGVFAKHRHRDFDVFPRGARKVEQSWNNAVTETLGFTVLSHEH